MHRAGVFSHLGFCSPILTTHFAGVGEINHVDNSKSTGLGEHSSIGSLRKTHPVHRGWLHNAGYITGIDADGGKPFKELGGTLEGEACKAPALLPTLPWNHSVSEKHILFTAHSTLLTIPVQLVSILDSSLGLPRCPRVDFNSRTTQLE